MILNLSTEEIDFSKVDVLNKIVDLSTSHVKSLSDINDLGQPFYINSIKEKVNFVSSLINIPEKPADIIELVKGLLNYLQNYISFVLSKNDQPVYVYLGVKSDAFAFTLGRLLPKQKRFDHNKVRFLVKSSNGKDLIQIN